MVFSSALVFDQYVVRFHGIMLEIFDNVEHRNFLILHVPAYAFNHMKFNYHCTELSNSVCVL